MKKSLSLTLTLLLFTAYTPAQGMESFPANDLEEKAKRYVSIENTTPEEGPVDTIERIYLEETGKKGPYDDVLAPFPALLLRLSLPELCEFYACMEETAKAFEKTYGIMPGLRRGELPYVFRALGREPTPAESRLMEYLTFLDAFVPKGTPQEGTPEDSNEDSNEDSSEKKVDFTEKKVDFTAFLSKGAQNEGLKYEDAGLLVSPFKFWSWPGLREWVSLRYTAHIFLGYHRQSLEHKPFAFRDDQFYSRFSKLTPNDLKDLAQNVSTLTEHLIELSLLERENPELDVGVLDLLVHHYFPEDSTLTINLKETLTFIYILLNKRQNEFLSLIQPELKGKFKNKLLAHSIYKNLQERRYFFLQEDQDWLPKKQRLWDLTKLQLDLQDLKEEATRLLEEQNTFLDEKCHEAQNKPEQPTQQNWGSWSPWSPRKLLT